MVTAEEPADIVFVPTVTYADGFGDGRAAVAKI